MPRKRRVSKRRSDLTEEQVAWLRGDYRNAGFINYVGDEALSALWNQYCDGIVADHADKLPGTRPGRWWKYTASETRKRVGGTGTPCDEALEGYFQRYRYGVPQSWVSPHDVEFYCGPPPANYGFRCRPKSVGRFCGVAISSNDPPLFESQASYLKRHGLFIPGEGKRLTKQDYEPEEFS